MTGGYSHVPRSLLRAPGIRKASRLAKLTYLALWSSPHVTRTGIGYVLPAYLAAELGEDLDDVQLALEELAEAELVEWDPDASVLLVRDYLGCNHLSSEKQVPPALREIHDLPPHRLLPPLLEEIRKHIGGAGAKEGSIRARNSLLEALGAGSPTVTPSTAQDRHPITVSEQVAESADRVSRSGESEADRVSRSGRPVTGTETGTETETVTPPPPTPPAGAGEGTSEEEEGISWSGQSGSVSPDAERLLIRHRSILGEARGSLSTYLAARVHPDRQEPFLAQVVGWAGDRAGPLGEVAPAERPRVLASALQDLMATDEAADLRGSPGSPRNLRTKLQVAVRDYVESAGRRRQAAIMSRLHLDETEEVVRL